MKKSLLSLGLLGSALAEQTYIDCGSQCTFKQSHGNTNLEMGEAIVVDHPHANGLFDISISLTENYRNTNGVDNDLGIKVTDISDINNGIQVLLKQGSACPTGAGAALSAADPDTIDITAAASQNCGLTGAEGTMLSACAIHPAPTDASTRSATKLACLSVQRSGHNYQKASVAVEFYDTTGINSPSREAYTDPDSDGIKLTEDYKFDASGMRLTGLQGHKDSPGLTAGAIVNGTATVTHDIKVRVGVDGAGDYKFEDCSYIDGTAPGLSIDFTGSEQSFIADAVTNGHGNGYASDYLNSHSYPASEASTARVHNGDKTCDLHFQGTHDLKFPIDKMLTSYWQSDASDCAHDTACNGKADITFGTDSEDVWAGAAVQWSTGTMSVQEIETVTKVTDPTSKFTTYDLDIQMADNLFSVTYKINSDANLETEVTFVAPGTPDDGNAGAVTVCSTPAPQLKLYQIQQGDLLNYIENQVDSCKVTYPVDYNVDYKIKFGGEESNEYRMLATDTGADADFTLQFSGESTLASVDDVTFDYTDADQITGRGFSEDQAKIVSCAAATIVAVPNDTPPMGSLTTSCVTGAGATASHKTSIKVYSASDAFDLDTVKSHQTSDGSHFDDMLCDTVTLKATVVAQVQDIAGELTAVPLSAKATFIQPADAHDDTDGSLSVSAWDTAGYDTDTVTHGDDRTVHNAVAVVYTPESGVTIASTTPLQLAADSVGPGGLQYNCDNGDSDQVITYSFEAQLPCKTGTTTVSKTTAYKVKYDKATQAELLQTEGIVGTAAEITASLAPASITEKAHHDIRVADAGYLSATTKYTSIAIRNDGDLSNLACDGSDADHPCSMSYEDNGTPSDSSDDYVLFTVLFKKQVDNGPTTDFVSDGAASRATITYTFNARCGAQAETATATFEPTFTIQRIDDKYRGRIDVSDYLNDREKITDASPYTDHLDDLTIDFGLQLGLGVYDETTNVLGVKNPSIYGVAFYKEPNELNNADAQSFNISWNTAKVKWVPNAENGNVDADTTFIPLNIAAGGNKGVLYFKPVEAADPNVDLGSSAGSFDVTVASGTSSRTITINIINLEPPARLSVKANDHTTDNDLVDENDIVTLCQDYSCYMNDNDNNKDSLGYQRVSFLMKIITVSSGSVTERSVTANGNFIQQKTITVDEDPNRFDFTVNSATCKNFGEITLVLDNSVDGTSVGDDITSTIRFPCRRAADQVDFRSQTKLDYSIDFQASLAAQSLSFGDSSVGVSREITTSDLSNSPLTCSSGGSTGGTAKCDDSTVTTNAAGINSLKTMSDFFKDCGSWDTTSNSDKDVGGMYVVRKFTGVQSDGSNQHYCQRNSLEWTVYKTGSSRQTITVQGFGGARFRFDLDKLEYTECTAITHKYAFEISGEVSTDDGNTWSETGLKLQNVQFSGEPNGLSDSGGEDDHLLTAGATQGECSNYCNTNSHTGEVTVSFTAIYVLPSTSQTIHADVTATLQMLGDPCSTSYVPEISQENLESTAAPSLEFHTVATAAQCNANAAWASTVQPNVNEKLCARIVDSSSVYPATLTSFTFIDNGGNGTTLTDIGTTGNTVDDFWLDNLQAEAVIQVTAYWSININGGSRRMLRTTYLLGSSSGESQASIQILPAGVQVQEQIEAAGASQEAPPASDVMAPAPSGVEDHSHYNTALIAVVSVVGGLVGLGFLWFMVTGFVRMSRGGVFVDLGGKKETEYRKVNRFQSNLAF